MLLFNLLRRLLVGIALFAGLWLVGLILFAAQVYDYGEPAITAELPAFDAIVVLTGGSERMGKGLALLEAGKGRKLFISGVPQKLTTDKILGAQPVTPKLKECCIFLGHAADDTIGNANETAAWIEAERFRSLYLVTSNYHMQRSLLLFRDALPEVDIHPFPVAPETVKLLQWWTWPGTSALLVTEYNKFLVAGLRVSLRDWLEELVEDLS